MRDSSPQAAIRAGATYARIFIRFEVPEALLSTLHALRPEASADYDMKDQEWKLFIFDETWTQHEDAFTTFHGLKSLT